MAHQRKTSRTVAAILCIALLAFSSAVILMPVQDAMANGNKPKNKNPDPTPPPPPKEPKEPDPSINWKPAGKACLPDTGGAIESWDGRERKSFDWDKFNFKTGKAPKKNDMPACHCPPSTYCPRDFGEWASHPRMPSAQATVCCPRPEICQVDETIRTGCGGQDGTTADFEGFCTSYTAKLLDNTIPPNPDINKENNLRKNTATSLTNCLGSCRSLIGKIYNNKNASENLKTFDELVTCERTCRIDAAKDLGYKTTNNSIEGKNVKPTTTPINGSNPIPGPVKTLLESKLACDDQNAIGYCVTRVSESCNDGGGDASGGDCLAAGSQITMADGSLKAIEEIKAGDKVKGYTSINTVTGTSFNLTINDKIYSINHDTLVITEGHPILTGDGWKAITPEKVNSADKDLAKLEVGDVILREGKEPVTITHLSAISAGTNTDRYNLSVDGDNTFIANGIVLRSFKQNVQY